MWGIVGKGWEFPFFPGQPRPPTPLLGILLKIAKPF